jgi:hypothetical protein
MKIDYNNPIGITVVILPGGLLATFGKVKDISIVDTNRTSSHFQGVKCIIDTTGRYIK